MKNLYPLRTLNAIKLSVGKFCMITLLFLFFCQPTFAQRFWWMKGLTPTAAADLYVDVKISGGFVYGAGNTAGISGYFDKRNQSDGSVVWQKQLTAPAGSTCTPYGIAVDNLGNVFVVGSYSGTVNFNPGGNATFNGSTSGFIAKYDANGNYQWTVALGLTPPSYSGIEVRDIQTAGSSVYVIGTMYNTSGVNFNPLGAADFKSANNNNNTFFASYSASSGTRNWVGQLPTGSSNLFNSLALCLNGGYLYLTGHTVNSGNFNPITFSGRQISISGGSTFVGKYDLDGKADDLSNNYVVGASGVSGDPYGIAVKGSNVYITGYQGNQNNQSYYLAKYNGSSWISRLIQGAGTGSTYNSGLDVAVDNNTPETAYLVGQFLGTNVNFGGIQVTSGDNGQNSDGFVAHYDANLICQRVSNISVTSRFGYFGFSGATSGIDLSGNDIAVAGSFGSQISYDKCSATDNLPSGSINSNGSNTDGYIGRYNPNAFPNSAGISIQGPTQVCPNRNVNYFVNTIPGIVNYQWEAPSGWTVVGGQGTSNVTFRTPNSGSLSGPVRLRVSNGCEFSASPITLFVSPSFSCGSSFAMAPNPADNIITISPADAIGSVQAAQTLKTAEPMRNDKPVQYIDFEVVIYDRLGQAILTAKNPENNTPLSINIGSLRPGIYIVQIISSFGKETKQLQILR